MIDKFRKISRPLFYAAMAIYPILVFYFLVIHKMPIRVLSLFIIALALSAFIAGTSKKKTIKKTGTLFRPAFLLFGIGALCLATNSGTVLKFYPVLMNLLFLCSFGITLFQPPSMIYRFAVMQDSFIPHSLREKAIAAYCRKVTIVWIAFFVINGNIAAWSIL